MKLKKEIRAAILAKDKNHEYGPDGFCLHCKCHRTDTLYMSNHLCPVLMSGKKKN